MDNFRVEYFLLGIHLDARLLYILSTVAVVFSVLASMIALTVALRTPPLDNGGSLPSPLMLKAAMLSENATKYVVQ